MTPDELAAWQHRATRPRRTVPVILDGDIRQRIEELAYELEVIDPAKTDADRRLGSKRVKAARAADIERELDELYGQAETATLQVVVEGLAGTPWAAFKAMHQPPREDVQADKLWRFNVETGREPLIRATVVGHRDGETIHPVDLDWLLGWATDWQLDKLFLAALETSRGDDAAPLRRPRSVTQSSDGA